MAITKEIKTGRMKSLVSRTRILDRLAPKILRIPISLVRWLTTKAARPSRPRQETKMARPAKMPKV